MSLFPESLANLGTTVTDGATKITQSSVILVAGSLTTVSNYVEVLEDNSETFKYEQLADNAEAKALAFKTYTEAMAKYAITEPA